MVSCLQSNTPGQSSHVLPPQLNPAVVIFRFQLWSQQRTKHSIGMSVIYRIMSLLATFYCISFTACFRLSVIFQNGLFNVREGQPPCFLLISKTKKLAVGFYLTCLSDPNSSRHGCIYGKHTADEGQKGTLQGIRERQGDLRRSQRGGR